MWSLRRPFAPTLRQTLMGHLLFDLLILGNESPQRSGVDLFKRLHLRAVHVAWLQKMEDVRWQSAQPRPAALHGREDASKNKHGGNAPEDDAGDDWRVRRERNGATHPLAARHDRLVIQKEDERHGNDIRPCG